jgi:hypothetical protein
MSAVLEPIAVRPLQFPVYLNDRIRDFGLWFTDNQNAITEFYNSLREDCEGEPLVDYFVFCAIQHEQEEAKLMAELV